MMPVPLHIGLTGGIGTGKSIIAKIFEVLGIPCLNADNIAKQLMNTDQVLIQSLKNQFGEAIYHNGQLQNKVLSDIVFQDAEKLAQLNSIVHPATIAYAASWMAAQQAPYVIKEAAILIESGSYKDMDYIIGVDAPIDLRIERTMRRDKTTMQAVQARIDKQMDNTVKMQFCDYVIVNDDQQSVLKQVLAIHESLMSKI